MSHTRVSWSWRIMKPHHTWFLLQLSTSCLIGKTYQQADLCNLYSTEHCPIISRINYHYLFISREPLSDLKSKFQRRGHILTNFAILEEYTMPEATRIYEDWLFFAFLREGILKFRFHLFIPTTTTSELLLGGIKVAEKTNYWSDFCYGAVHKGRRHISPHL